MFKLDAKELGYLQEAIAVYNGDAEKEVNAVLHGEAGKLIHDAVKRLIPRSNVENKKHAKDADSLRQINYNLAVKISTKGKYGYLYFPDDGTNTKNHVGEKHFFQKGGDEVTPEIVERCIARLYGSFENFIGKK